MSNTAPKLLRRSGRRLMQVVPESRRVKGLGGAKGRRLLQVRKLVAPAFQVPVILTTRDGLKLRVTSDPVDEQIAQHLLGSRRPDYFPLWPNGVPHAPCILDVGAHHGLYAAAALHEYPGSRVVCAEPSRQAIPAVRANLALNGFENRARIVDAALAPAAGTGELVHARDGSWGYSLFEDAADANGSESVRLATLAEILDGDTPDIVKSNAEGAEFSLIDQLEQLAVRPLLLVVMVHPEFGDMERLLTRAASMGYRVDPINAGDRPAFHMWHSRA